MSTTPDQLAQKRQEILNGREGRAQESPAPHAPEPKQSRTQRASSKLSMLAQAASAAQQVRRVTLPDLSAAFGQLVEVELGTISVQTLLASGMLPGPAREILKSMIDRSEALTQGYRDRVGMENLVGEIADEDFGGDQVYVAGGVIQLLRALAVLGARDFYCDGEPNEPPIQLTTDKTDTTRLYIGILTDRDVELLSGALWQGIEGVAAEATPFSGTGEPPVLVRTGEAVLDAAERSERSRDI
ncbi:MAG: hypothetical protein ACR2M1_10545 [Gemmatimonadaceae bacterium]